MTDRDDNLPHPIEFAARAAANVGPDFYRAFKDANSGDPHREARGLIEMTVLNIREGVFPGREFQKLPVHLPDTEREMRALALSHAPADRPLKEQLVAWATSNRGHHDQAAKALQVAAAAFRRADAVLADEQCTDAELGEWCDVVAAHVLAVWKVDIRECPAAPHDAERWARDVVGRFNITPDWIGETGKPPSTFEPAKYRGARNPFGAFRSRGGDDE